jgi:ribose-phosphate pyrophosphokinase
VLEQPLAPLEHRPFDDGEHKWRPMVDPAGADAVVLASLHGDAHLTPQDKLVRLLVVLATLRDHGASRVTALLPYLAYARKDVRTQPFDPLTSRLVAQWLEASGCDRVVALEVHNPAAFENAHRIPTQHVDGWLAFDEAVSAGTDPVAASADGATGEADRPLVVASPDPGGVKRAQRWREHLESRLARPVGFAMVDKRRSLGLVSGGRLVAGDVQGARVLLLDDLVATGHTLAAAAAALHHAGAAQVEAFAAHGLFTGDADAVLAASCLRRLVVSDSVPAFRLPPSAAFASRLQVVSAAPWLARAVAG